MDKEVERFLGLFIENVLEVIVMGLMEDRGFSVVEEGFCDFMVFRRLVGFVIFMDDLNGDGGEIFVGLEEEIFFFVVLFVIEEDGGIFFEFVVNVDEIFFFLLVLICILVLLIVIVCGGNVVLVVLIFLGELELSFGDLLFKILGFLFIFLDLVFIYLGIVFIFLVFKEIGVFIFIIFL